jgi:hypothetical protein
LTANCELTAAVSFPLEQESMKDKLLQFYESFSEEFSADGFGQCGPPMIMLPQTVEIGGVKTIIPGKFAFDCSLSLLELRLALGKLRGTLKDRSPEPELSVTLYDRDSRNHIRLYPQNDIEFYLSDS